MTEPLERDTTVLFAHVLGGADLIAKGGDAPAVGSLKACVDHLRKSAEDCGARVIDSGSERLMVLLATPDAAADAAAAMHTAMDTFPQYTDVKLALGIGFHHGPVIQKDDQVIELGIGLAHAQHHLAVGEDHVVGFPVLLQLFGRCGHKRKWGLTPRRLT